MGPDGFALRETVAEYIQMIDLHCRELEELSVDKPEGMSDDQSIRLYGGGVMIFDEYCRLKYHVRNKIGNAERQTAPAQIPLALWVFRSSGRGEKFRRHASHAIRLKEIPPCRNSPPA